MKMSDELSAGSTPTGAAFDMDPSGPQLGLGSQGRPNEETVQTQKQAAKAALVRSLRGKFAHLLGSTAEFMNEKLQDASRR